MQRHRRGFTLLEILLVVAAIAILAGIVIVAINPAQQLAETRDAQRRSDVGAISSALVQFTIKTGAYPDNINVYGGDPACPSYEVDDTLTICKGEESCSNGMVLAGVLTPGYIPSIPVDPSMDSNEEYSGYVAYINNDDRLVVCAPLAEEDTISITR